MYPIRRAGENTLHHRLRVMAPIFTTRTRRRLMCSWPPRISHNSHSGPCSQRKARGAAGDRTIKGPSSARAYAAVVVWSSESPDVEDDVKGGVAGEEGGERVF